MTEETIAVNTAAEILRGWRQPRFVGFAAPEPGDWRRSETTGLTCLTDSGAANPTKPKFGAADECAKQRQPGELHDKRERPPGGKKKNNNNTFINTNLLLICHCGIYKIKLSILNNRGESQY